MPNDYKAALYFVLSVYITRSSSHGSAKPGVIAEWEFGKSFRQIKGRGKKDMNIQNLASDKSKLEHFSVDCIALLSGNNKIKVKKNLSYKLFANSHRCKIS